MRDAPMSSDAAMSTDASDTGLPVGSDVLDVPTGTDVPNATDAGPATGEIARSADSFVDSVGVCVHLGYPNTPYVRQFDTVIHPRLMELGVRHLRSDLVMPGSVGATNLTTLASGSRPIRTMLIMNPGMIAPSDVPALAHSLLPGIEAIEGPNEPNLAYEHFTYMGMGFPAGVRAYQRDLSAAVQAATDPAVRALPVVATALGQPNPTDSMMLGDISAWVDFASLHNYPGGRNPIVNLNARLALAQQVGGTSHRVFLTESGYHNAVPPLPMITASQPGISEEAGGRYTPRLFLLNFNDPRAARTYEYEFIDQVVDTGGMTDQEHHFGLLHNDGSTKPAFDAMRNLITLLDDPGPAFAPMRLDYALAGDMTNIQHTLLARRDGRIYLILWQEVASYDLATNTDLTIASRALTLTLNTTFSRATLYAPHAGSTPIAAPVNNPHTLMLHVPDHVLVVELTP